MQIENRLKKIEEKLFHRDPEAQPVHFIIRNFVTGAAISEIIHSVSSPIVNFERNLSPGQSPWTEEEIKILIAKERSKLLAV